MEPEETSEIVRIYRSTRARFDRWYNNIKSSNKENLKKLNPSYKTSFEHLFPHKDDLPEVRLEKFDNLVEIWRPKTDLIALTQSPVIALALSSCAQLPFLVTVRKLLKVTSYNRIMAVTSSVAMAAGSSAIVVANQVDTIIRGEVDCAECHLIRTGAYQFFFTSLFPASSAVLISTLSALLNPGIALPVDVLERWLATKEGIKIIGRSLFQRKLIFGFIAVVFANVSVGVGLVYYAMKQYRDVHERLLDDHTQTVLI